jgi:iron-sulfur cluster assembly protein
MLQEIETPTTINADTVTISDTASEAVRGILSEKKLEGFGLRIYVAGSGCGGASFGMALDNNIRSNDFTFLSQDVQIIIDDQSLPFLRGAKIDFVNDPQRGAGFIVDSPSNTGSCSCGSKSQNHSDSEDSACACGGSCSCNN